MRLTKKSIKAKKGTTLYYQILNIREENSNLKWDAFRLYTPEGGLVDTEGYAYIEIPAGEILISRDDMVTKELKVLVTKEKGVEVFEVLEGAEQNLVLGLEGDIIITGVIPPGTEQIEIEYKEVK